MWPLCAVSKGTPRAVPALRASVAPKASDAARAKLDAATEDELSELSDSLAHMLEAPERGPDSEYTLAADDAGQLTVWVIAQPPLA